LLLPKIEVAARQGVQSGYVGVGGVGHAEQYMRCTAALTRARVVAAKRTLPLAIALLYGRMLATLPGMS